MADLQSRLDLTLSDFPYIDGFLPTVADLVALNIVKEQDLEGKHHLKRWYKHINTFSQDDKNKFSHALTSDFAKYLLNSRPLVYVMSSKESTIDLIDDLPQLVLSELDANSQGFNTIHMAAKLSIDHQKLIGVIKSLLAQEGVISTEDVTEKRLELSSEGRELAKNGSHEFNVYQEIGENGLLQDDLKKLSFGKLGMNKAMAAGWIMIDKVTGKVVRKVQSDSVVDSVRQKLEALARGETVDEKTKADLKKRKLVNEITVKSLYVKRGLQFTTDIKKLEADLTPEMIASGSWKTTTFKKYNFNALGIQPACGHLHPLMKVRSEFRQIFFSMGFSEMPTNRYVESCFWNFDALFQPQQHPARDAHDTFFISDPAISTVFPSEYLERVKTVHSNGGYGSIGYNYDWKLEEAQKNVLRTHTTAVSARQLYKLAQQGFKPTKMFSIDRVFRNETLDATHLAEFHQVEGVIAERNLSLSHLIGVFTEFFRKLGIEGLRFKPAYNPYTEPSMEIFAYHKGLKKWVEIGNSGMFRPEMLLPMGIPPDVNVAGYGLSLERPTMIRYGIDNIREMFGPKVDLEMVYSGPICRLDKKLADK